MPAPTKNTAHVAQGLARLTDQFKGKAVIEGILKSFLASIQNLENAIFDVIMGRLLDSAVDDQLDQLGKIVGEARESRSNDDYRAAIRIRIRVNRSNGRTEDVIQVATLSLGAVPFLYLEEQPATWDVRVYNIAVAEARALIKLLGQTKAAGTRGFLWYSTWTPTENFRWGSTTGTVGVRGFTSIYGGASVSRWVAIEEVHR